MAKKYLQLSKILKRLLFDRDMKPIDLAREVNIPPPTIHRLITGKSTRPYGSSLKPIADYFSISINQLLGETPLPTDQQNLAHDQSKHPVGKTTINIPLIPWDAIQTMDLLDKDSFEKLPFVGNVSEHSYATIMPDFSMEPIFSRGCVLIFDPLKTPKDRSFILVQSYETKAPVFRQLLIDLDHKYLKPLNPDLNAFKMRLIGDNDKILATLIESRQIFDDSTLL